MSSGFESTFAKIADRPKKRKRVEQIEILRSLPLKLWFKRALIREFRRQAGL